MDDDKGLELSLGLACGGSSSNSKDKSGNSIDGKTEPTDTDERTNKVISEFKNFLCARVPESFQRNDAGKPRENFFSNLQRTDIDGTASKEELGVSENKRKCTFDEMNNHKKRETNSRDSDLQEKGKTSHISITTDEGSTADNEDVADSEAEGLTSRLAFHHEDGSGSSCQTPKERSGKTNSSSPFTMQSMNALNVPYSITIKESPSVTAPSTSSYPLSGLMQGIAFTNGVFPRPYTSVSMSLPMSFGFSPAQLPVLNNDNTWRVGVHPQALPSPFPGKSLSTSGLDVRSLEHSKDQTQLLVEEGSTSHIEDDTKGRGNSFPLEFPAIRPGIAAEVNFGGSGAFPNLPWVSTTSQGSNGRTISGVTYKYNATQIKIVCACHGTHMSPEEFVCHATEDEQSSATTPNISSLRSTNPTTSAMT